MDYQIKMKYKYTMLWLITVVMIMSFQSTIAVNDTKIKVETTLEILSLENESLSNDDNLYYPITMPTSINKEDEENDSEKSPFNVKSQGKYFDD